MDHLKSRLAGQGVSATRTTLANAKALERAGKLLAYANLKRAELSEMAVRGEGGEAALALVQKVRG